MHFITHGNMASNADSKIDEVRKERLRRRREHDKLRKERETNYDAFT